MSDLTTDDEGSRQLRVARIVMLNLPEKNGCNASLFLIDDIEIESVVDALNWAETRIAELELSIPK